jgi:hypothetical protein
MQTNGKGKDTGCEVEGGRPSSLTRINDKSIQNWNVENQGTCAEKPWVSIAKAAECDEFGDENV